MILRTCPYRKLDLAKKNELKEPWGANHSVCRSRLIGSSGKPVTRQLLGP